MSNMRSYSGRMRTLVSRANPACLMCSYVAKHFKGTLRPVSGEV